MLNDGPRSRIAMGIALSLLTFVLSLGQMAMASSPAEQNPQVEPIDVGWTGRCPYTRSARVDPIVSPGEKSAHLHDFFGTRPDANYDFDDFRANGTLCKLIEDTAGYWIPSLYIPNDEGVPVRVKPTEALVYWTGPPEALGIKVFSMPRNLKMIAGDHMSPGPQPLNVVWYDCSGDGPYSPRAAAPYLCPSDHVVRSHVLFPSCWDGVPPAPVGDDSAHMAYPTHEKCRPGWFRVPQVHLIASYPIQDGRGATLSSGGGRTDPTSIYTLHGDYFHAWEQTVQTQLVIGCLNDEVEADCGLPATPVIERIDPPGGPVGLSVTVGGSGFNGVLAVAFNGVPAPFVVTSSTSITAVVPQRATTGPVTVTSDGGTGVAVQTTGVSPEDFVVE